MICPECGSEYREGFVQCVDCEIPLVEGTAEDLVHEPPPALLASASEAPPVQEDEDGE